MHDFFAKKNDELQARYKKYGKEYDIVLKYMEKSVQHLGYPPWVAIEGIDQIIQMYADDHLPKDMPKEEKDELAFKALHEMICERKGQTP